MLVLIVKMVHLLLKKQIDCMQNYIGVNLEYCLNMYKCKALKFALPFMQCLQIPDVVFLHFEFQTL